jgi:hypothetical protein
MGTLLAIVISADAYSGNPQPEISAAVAFFKRPTLSEV